MTVDRLREVVEEMGAPQYRAEQLANWVYRKGVVAPEEMSNLPRGLVERFDILTSQVVHRSETPDGTVKLLLQFPDTARIETVMIPSDKRVTVCLSTQVGCAMGCVFCATGLDGLTRNLTTGEILEQMLHLRVASAERLTNVVFMGMGEPLANLEATVAAIRAIVDPRRFAISARSVTVSTVGLPEQIRALARCELPITLAISLHAPNDELRKELVPVGAKYPLEQIMDAAREFYRSRRREVTLEYVLLSGINDTKLCAEQLAALVRQLRCRVNLIPYNPVESLPYSRPTQVEVRRFAERLTRHNINVQVRHPRGLEAGCACGQLRSRTKPDVG